MSSETNGVGKSWFLPHTSFLAYNPACYKVQVCDCHTNVTAVAECRRKNSIAAVGDGARDTIIKIVGRTCFVLELVADSGQILTLSITIA